MTMCLTIEELVESRRENVRKKETESKQIIQRKTKEERRAQRGPSLGASRRRERDKNVKKKVLKERKI